MHLQESRTSADDSSLTRQVTIDVESDRGPCLCGEAESSETDSEHGSRFHFKAEFASGLLLLLPKQFIFFTMSLESCFLLF